MHKKIEIIPIARKKAEKRGVSEAQILDTVNSPDQTVEGYEGRTIAQKKYIIRERQFLLRVVYEQQNEVVEVITAYLTSKVDRYWRKENEN